VRSKPWSDPTILSLVLFAINDSVHSETGRRPLDTKFGSDDGLYFWLPDSVGSSKISSGWVKALREGPIHIQAMPQKLLEERTKDTPVEQHNGYQKGSLVLFKSNPDLPLPTKLLSPIWTV